MIIQIGVILFILYAATIGFHGYAMYEILRIVVMIQALIYAFLFYEDNKPVSAIFAGIAVLFNPLMKIRFSRGEWEVLDLGVAIIFAGTLAWLYWASNKNKKEKEVRKQAFKENKQMSVEQDREVKELFYKNRELEAKYYGLKTNYEELQNRYNNLMEKYDDLSRERDYLRRQITKLRKELY